MDNADRSTDASGRPASLARVVEDGVFAGMIGALLVALWFLALDAFAGHPLFTPSLLGAVLLHGVDPTQYSAVEPQNVAIYTALHFVAFILLGTLASYLFTLLDRYPVMGIVLIFLMVFFEVGFFALDLALGGHLMGRLHAWAVAVANLLAGVGMAGYLWWRHPTAVRMLQRVWED